MEINNISGPDVVQSTFSPDQVVQHQEQPQKNETDSASENEVRVNPEGKGTIIDTYV